MATFAERKSMKYLLGFGFLLLVLVVTSCGTNTDKQTAEPASATQQGYRYSAAFLASFSGSLAAYYQLKDAFVLSDTVAVHKAAIALRTQLDSLSLEEVRLNDSIAYDAVTGRPGDIIAEIDALLAEKGLEEKRLSFEMISNAFYDMLRSIRPAGVTAYYQYCPMAFKDKGAYWLSKNDSIRNPYFGADMLTCGEVKETLKY